MKPTVQLQFCYMLLHFAVFCCVLLGFLGSVLLSTDRPVPTPTVHHPPPTGHRQVFQCCPPLQAENHSKIQQKIRKTAKLIVCYSVLQFVYSCFIFVYRCLQLLLQLCIAFLQCCPPLQSEMHSKICQKKLRKTAKLKDKQHSFSIVLG